MLKKVIIVLSVMLLAILGWCGYLFITDFLNLAEEKQEKLETEKKSDDEDTNNRDIAGGNLSDDEMEELEEKGFNPFGEKKEYEDLTDKDYQEYIHGMSHQKVKADEKWGFYKITDERIDWLIEGLKIADLKHKSVYEEILNKWDKGDFSTADDDHNAIWNLQGGTIGKAYGILTPEEEKAYIESQE